MFEIIKSILYGIVEGITEWLPISSTGHIILVQSIIPFKNMSPGFTEMFNYVIQLGAIISVIVLFWQKLWPFKMPDKGCAVLSVDTGIFKKDQWILWSKVLVATIPSAFAIFIDSYVDGIMYNENGSPTKLGISVISGALILYGILFIVIERWNKHRRPVFKSTNSIDYKTAFLIGCFQFLAIIPGTSRSGSTILGAIILGLARPIAAEFSFFMAIPTMVGVSVLKIFKFLSESSFTYHDVAALFFGMVVSFIVSCIVIKALMNYVKRKDFSFFGYYRIVLGIIVILFSVLV